eukprot:TRINITY_DN3961_c0_g1_i1.p1 TRINITY_DN3961_c0_g1~~TRINITY_DN3961_c0_g1_i1.p1  ORF type:complete len:259 (+),score=64.80 TRINITY_DN3961_c0_g1_i1:358-1134(+)
MDSYKNISSKTVSVGITWPWEYTEKSYFYPNHSVAVTISSVTSTQKATSLSSLFATSTSSVAISCDNANKVIVSMLFNTTASTGLYWSLYQKNNKTDTFEAGDYNGFTFCVSFDTTYVLTTFNSSNADSGSSNMSFVVGFRRTSKGSLYTYRGSHGYSKSTEFTVSSVGGLTVSVTQSDGSSGSLTSVSIPSSGSSAALSGGAIAGIVIACLVVVGAVAFAIWWKKTHSATAGRVRVFSNAPKNTEIAVVPDAGQKTT